MFKSVAHDQSLKERAQLQIEELILNGSLSTGDRLPSERELTKKLEVSKTVVREAIRALESKGLVHVRQGSGMYVRAVNSDLIKEPLRMLLRANALGIEHIYEVRKVLEVHIAGLAAKLAHPAQLKAMEETIEALRKPNVSAKAFAQLDVTFHNYLAVAAGNPLFSALVNSLNDVMIDLRLQIFQTLGSALAIARAVSYHSLILERVKARDVEGARQAMEEHLAVSLKDRVGDSFLTRSRERERERGI